MPVANTKAVHDPMRCHGDYNKVMLRLHRETAQKGCSILQHTVSLSLYIKIATCRLEFES